MHESTVEALLKLRKAWAPRLTPELIDAAIIKESYLIFPETTVTVCCLTLVNGFNVVGYSSCASIENFNKEIGEKVARTNARDKIWDLEGYLLKQKLYEDAQNVTA